MSKTISELKRLQEHRQNGNSHSTSDASQPINAERRGQYAIRNTQYEKRRTYAVPSVIMYLLLTLNFALSLGLLALFYSSRTERQTTLTQLNSTIQAMELSNAALLSSFTKKFNQASVEIEKASKRTEEMGVTVKELNKEQEAQRFAIETLTKAKNTLFNRINLLEANLNSKSNE
ncbi:MAG: hypothetical protein AB1530_00240 [Candidatus Omnitrophota bacterium]